MRMSNVRPIASILVIDLLGQSTTPRTAVSHVVAPTTSLPSAIIEIDRPQVPKQFLLNLTHLPTTTVPGNKKSIGEYSYFGCYTGASKGCALDDKSYASDMMTIESCY
ncbi:hypothetical protein BJ875DRAFT_184569 [Amylocarpus encephaloides]|uniref:Uncharacterized protein n=1 Tax=Amylocarpus encephaloides TaxID=45428 RepID=A0A9P7YNZ9_9HELO|nr:hypothetical protein BJ875DRAFT_184569 [Amylocarpus encephaloides]